MKKSRRSKTSLSSTSKRTNKRLTIRIDDLYDISKGDLEGAAPDIPDDEQEGEDEE